MDFGVTVDSVEAARETPPETCRTSTSVAGSASRTLRPTVRLRTGTGGVPMTEIRKFAPLKQLVDAGWPVWFGDRRGAVGATSSFYPGNGPSFC